MRVPKLRFSVSEFIRELAISNSSIWAIHFRAENVINREETEWQIYGRFCTKRNKCVIKLKVDLVENLNFFLQLLQHASVLVRGLKYLYSGVGRDSAVFSRYSF